MGESSQVQENSSVNKIPEEIEAFCSLGPKACPVELDINSARLESEVYSFFRRLRLTERFKDADEKRFYTRKPDYIPEAGRSAPLDMFLWEFQEKFRSWKPPRRIKDNLTPIERKGKNMLRKDLEKHVYKLEDKGSCLVRMDKLLYERNVKRNLESSTLYEELDDDPTEEINERVEKQVTKMNNLGELKDTTKEFILGGEVHPGVYYENPKTHKFEEDADLSLGFKARGINSIKSTPTEHLGDYPLRDTKHTLQLIEEKNEIKRYNNTNLTVKRCT